MSGPNFISNTLEMATAVASAISTAVGKTGALGGEEGVGEPGGGAGEK
jgi:hypothetical protein